MRLKDFCLSIKNGRMQMVRADIIAAQADRDAKRCWRRMMCKAFDLDAEKVEAHARERGGDTTEALIRHGEVEAWR